MTESLRTYVHRSWLNGALFFLLLVFTGASLFSFIGFAISELFLGIPLLTQQELLENMTDPELLPALRLLQVLQGFGMLILPSVGFLWISESSERLKQVFQVPTRQSVMLSIALFLVAFPFINYVAEWNASWNIPTAMGDWMEQKEQSAGKLTELFLDMPSVWFLVLNVVMIGLLPAVGEELIFRGIIQRGLQKQIGNPHAAIWLAAILFSAFHFQFLGFVPRMLMGVAMGYLLYWSGNLWYPIIAHFTNNASAVILNYGIQHGDVDSAMDQAGTGNSTMAVFSLVFCMMLLYLFKRHQEAAASA
ncbi:MAG: CPBP family intramembrane metalloprotease [Flavobacteriales bacterium]|nr:CPBP family intramembrane metalloprotease [Flavobacteriales bacterium]